MTAPAHLSVVLASRSPARLRVLRGAGVAPHVVVSTVDEAQLVADQGLTAPADIAAALAHAKAFDVAQRGDVTQPTVVVGCDSVLEFRGEVFGKPGSRDEARQRWQQMRGRVAMLHSGHCVVLHGVNQQRHVGAVGQTSVHFANVSDAEIDWYVNTDEPLEVAGAFTIDGFAGPFIERVEGDHHNVLGLSLPLLRTLLAQLDVPWPSIISAAPEPDASP